MKTVKQQHSSDEDARNINNADVFKTRKKQAVCVLQKKRKQFMCVDVPFIDSQLKRKRESRQTKRLTVLEVVVVGCRVSVDCLCSRKHQRHYAKNLFQMKVAQK